KHNLVSSENCQVSPANMGSRAGTHNSSDVDGTNNTLQCPIFGQGKVSPTQKKSKLVKSRSNLIELVVGKDVTLDAAIQMDRKTLVGKYVGRKVGLAGVGKWITDNWLPILNYSPTFHLLCKDWIGFCFDSVDVVVIQRQQWFLDTSIMLMYPWTPLFNLVEAKLVENPIWVKVPSLPLEWWTDEGLKAIRDWLGGTLAIDNSYKTSLKHTVARILVNLQAKDRLYENIVLVHNNRRLSLPLDYINVPFRCARCHKLGHLYDSCPLKTFSRKWIPKSHPLDTTPLIHVPADHCSPNNTTSPAVNRNQTFGGILS
ncbi:hypothetical protein KI387_011719, partial [Taxus chinensis]